MYSIPFVVLLGMGIVFAGLVSIIFLTMLMSYVLRERGPGKDDGPVPAAVLKAHQRQETKEDTELISTMFAVLADDLHMDLSNARITVKKI